MAQANGKLLGDYLRLKSTKAYIEAVSVDMQIPISEVVDVVKGGQVALQGTWGHKLIALHLAQWISPSFHVWCNAHIFNLMATGQTSLDIDPVQEMKLKIELAKLERDKAAIENRTIELRHAVVTTCPEHVQQKILGYQLVEKVEYRDRVLFDDDVIRDGSTLNKTQLCHRLGILTTKGKPNYKKLNAVIEKAALPSEAFKLTAAIRENEELRAEFLPALEKFYNEGDRQLWMGE